MSEAVIRALLVQRWDVQGFGASLQNAFATLPRVSKIKSLPKPYSFQDYLRGPMKELEGVLQVLHQNYHNPALLEAFLTAVAVLPQTVARIFGFRETLFLVDHIDCADVAIKIERRSPIALFEFLKFSLNETQYLISCREGEALPAKLGTLDADSVDLASKTAFLSVFGRVSSEFEEVQLAVEIKCTNPTQDRIAVTAKHAGGAPGYVWRFNQICIALREFAAQGERADRKKYAEICNLMAAFLKAVMDFSDVGGLEKVANVRFETPPPGPPEPPAKA
jgi:hypothetical protein